MLSSTVGPSCAAGATTGSCRCARSPARRRCRCPHGGRTRRRGMCARGCRRPSPRTCASTRWTLRIAVRASRYRVPDGDDEQQHPTRARCAARRRRLRSEAAGPGAGGRTSCPGRTTARSLVPVVVPASPSSRAGAPGSGSAPARGVPQQPGAPDGRLGSVGGGGPPAGLVLPGHGVLRQAARHPRDPVPRAAGPSGWSLRGRSLGSRACDSDCSSRRAGVSTWPASTPPTSGARCTAWRSTPTPAPPGSRSGCTTTSTPRRRRPTRRRTRRGR